MGDREIRKYCMRINRELCLYCGLVFTSSENTPKDRLRQNGSISVSREGPARQSGAAVFVLQILQGSGALGSWPCLS